MGKRGFRLLGRGVFLNIILTVLFIAVISAIAVQYQILSSSNPSGLDGNITYEPANFTHLNISDQTPYPNLVGYWSFDSDNLGGFYE